MKRVINLFILFLSSTVAYSQVETFTNYSYNGVSYNAFIVKIDTETVDKFIILRNDSLYEHQLILSTLLGIDSSFLLVNACISDSLCRPIGYFCNNFQNIQPVNLNDGIGNFFLKPNGALLFLKDDVIICESSDIASKQNIRLGVQSGPMLLHNGIINPQFTPNSSNKNRRCGVGTFLNNKGEKFLVFAITNTSASFFEFATFFSNRFKCKNALCLESAGCSMYFPSLYDPNSLFNGLICNYLLFQF